MNKLILLAVKIDTAATEEQASVQNSSNALQPFKSIAWQVLSTGFTNIHPAILCVKTWRLNNQLCVDNTTGSVLSNNKLQLTMVGKSRPILTRLSSQHFTQSTSNQKLTSFKSITLLETVVN